MDMAVLRRQWLREAAMLFPKAEAYGPESSSFVTLKSLFNRNVSLTTAILHYNPAAYLEMSFIDMDRLERVGHVNHEWYVFIYVCISFSRFLHPPVLLKPA